MMTNFFGSKNKNKNRTNLFQVRESDYSVDPDRHGAEVIRVDGEKLTTRAWLDGGEVMVTTTPMGDECGVVVSVLMPSKDGKEIGVANYFGKIPWASVEEFLGEDIEEREVQ